LFGYLEVKCLGCDTHQTVALDIDEEEMADEEEQMRCVPFWP
jgi:hypothetical protein